jgi:hypothetical protein
LKEQYREIWENADSELCIELLEEWIKIAWETGLEPIRKFIITLNKHWYGIIEYFNRRISNGFAERVNLKIQEIKRLAKGYRNIDNFINMIYFHLGGLKFNNPQYMAKNQKNTEDCIESYFEGAILTSWDRTAHMLWWQGRWFRGCLLLCIV